MDKQIKMLEDEAVEVDGLKVVSLSVAKRALESLYSEEFNKVTDNLKEVMDNYQKVIKDIKGL